MPSEQTPPRVEPTDTHVLVHGVKYTPDEARKLANDILGTASTVEYRRRAAELRKAWADERAILAAKGCTHIEPAEGRPQRWRGANGLPCVRDSYSGRVESPTKTRDVGAGPALEYRVHGGRKWHSIDGKERWGKIVAWRVKEGA